MYGSRYYRPALKNSVDVQLQTAFNEGLWSNVARLAAQRFKAKKDPYYEAVRVCAESQMDTVTEKSAVVFAVDALARDKAAVPDLDSIELYEWALREAAPPLDYAQTVGVLRARWAKANPASPGVVECLKACVLAWDLVNAQQIAATLDKGQPGTNNGKNTFWNITLTHLLSTSPQCPENMRVMFGKLSRMQLEKAAAIASDPKATGRGLREEEEINLYYHVAGKDAYLKSLSSASDRSSPIGVLEQFGLGRKHLLQQGLETLREAGDWETIYNTCRQALSKEDADGRPSFLALDMRTWKLFVRSAGMQGDVEAAFAEVQEVLQRFVAVQQGVAPMYKKNIGLALLELAFSAPAALVPQGLDPGRPSYRVVQLYLFVEQHLLQRATFDDVKEYVSRLTFEEARHFVDNLGKTVAGKTPDAQRQLVVRVLEIKFRYFLTTCPLTQEPTATTTEAGDAQLRCRFCSTTTTAGNCTACLEAVATDALTAYKNLDKTPEATTRALDKDPHVDLALAASSALLKLSGLGAPSRLSSPLGSAARPARLLQAAMLLAAQLSRTPDEMPLRLLLVRVYLLLGCGSLAHAAWVPTDVKRTIQDALSPLFFDRLSGVAPGLFHPPAGRQNSSGSSSLTEPLSSYYSGCLRDRSPVKIWDAFAAGSYCSVLDMAAYSDRLRRSCTLAMAVVEERRAARALGGKMEGGGIEQSPLLAHITDDTTFVNAVDYGSFPNLESPHAAPLHEIVRLGPALSDERTRLALLTEHFLDTITHKPPKDYKPAKAAEAAARDKAHQVETHARLSESLSTLLHRTTATTQPQLLTPDEQKYYTLIAALSTLTRTALETPKSASAPAPATFTAAAATAHAALDALHASVLGGGGVPPGMARLPGGEGAVLHHLTSPLSLSALRDAALAARWAAAALLASHADESARDRSGRGGLHREVLAAVRGLEGRAGEVLGGLRGRVGELRGVLGLGGWLDRVEGWAFGDGGDGDDDGVAGLVREVVGEAEVEEWGGRVVESWRDGVKGFALGGME
ncbi:hypothetical protein KVR01_013426 [Diaporthe batatas]|uniref:uncharacterized protein n=1 Tax=Diaporthe batatas TaxID=748121 RepID=UPI001D053B24|nr:uncharacterized protein KVR01_013426 [Diaporthe batatas]KAG8156821.1 hypothetical protein KVR01_013426 [Diaporthe batatas]